MSYNYLRRYKTKSQNGKRKRLMIGCGNHIDNDCEKGPKLKTKDIILVFPTKYFISTPPSSSHPQSMVDLNTMITCDWPPSHY